MEPLKEKEKKKTSPDIPISVTDIPVSISLFSIQVPIFKTC